jgi:hypothetical protein
VFDADLMLDLKGPSLVFAPPQARENYGGEMRSATAVPVASANMLPSRSKNLASLIRVYELPSRATTSGSVSVQYPDGLRRVVGGAGKSNLRHQTRTR